MTLSSRQMLVTEDLKQYSLSSYDPLISYSAGNTVKDSTGVLYNCILSAPAGTLLTNTTFFSPVGGTSSYGNGIDPASTALNTTGVITGKSTSIGSNSIMAILPALASAIIGDIYYIKVGNFTGCTLSANGSETIDGSTIPLALNPYQGYTLRKSSSTNWEIVSDYNQLSGDGSGIVKTQKTVGANIILTAMDKFTKVTAASVVVTLPLLSSVKAGDIFVIKNGNFFGNTVVPQGTDVIDGVAGAELLMPYEMMQLRASVGLTEWEKI